MLSEYRLKILLLMAVLLLTFLGTFGTLAAIPVLAMIVIAFSVFFMNFFGSQWLPTPDSIIDRIIRETEPGKGDVVYDLGAGGGRVVVRIAKKTKAQVRGLELDAIKWLIGAINIRRNRLGNARMLRQNFFSADISDATIVFCYLPRPTLKKLSSRLKRLKKGTLVVSYCVPAEGLKLIKELKHHIYIYRI